MNYLLIITILCFLTSSLLTVAIIICRKQQNILELEFLERAQRCNQLAEELSVYKKEHKFSNKTVEYSTDIINSQQEQLVSIRDENETLKRQLANRKGQLTKLNKKLKSRYTT